MNYSFHQMATQDRSLLRELGARIRGQREVLRMTVTELAERSELSRRYVTEAEAGRANLSVLKLSQLARALRVSLASLCDLPSTQTGAERIALVGLRGAGKTTLGRSLARALEVPFVELDERIERRAGLSLAAIFDLEGAESYRRLEREALEEVLAEGQRQVIATGGSIVTSEETYARLRGACRTVWLRAAPEEHLRRVLEQGDHRPIDGRPRAFDELCELLERRSSLYALADEEVQTSQRTPDEVLAELVARIDPTDPTPVG